MKREPGLDYIRVISTLMIIGFHFGCYSASSAPLFMTYANGSIAVTFVALFFMLSGAGLYLNYGANKLCLKQFWFKRWKGTLLPFYLVFLFCLLYKGMINGRLFYLPNASPATLLLSAFGLDGYFLYRIPSYYSIGEWFLGAIVLLYLLYPLLQWLVNRLWWATWLVSAALFGVVHWMVDAGVYADWFQIDWTRNLIVCLFSFVTGMCLIRHAKRLKNIFVFAGVLAVTAVLLFVRIPGLPHAVNWVTAIGCFIVLLNIGSWLGQGGIYPFVRRFSALTYGMYLVHHVLIVQIVPAWNPVDPATALATLAAIILLTAVFSRVLEIVVREITQSRPFRWLEKHCTGQA